MKSKRVIGTSEQAISSAESELGRVFPTSFREWLLKNNGLGITDFTIYPVFDSRDPRKTWHSIVKHYRENWLSWTTHFPEKTEQLKKLVPFGDMGTGDYFCFDYRDEQPGEPIIFWDHETGKTKPIARSFAEFAEKALSGGYSTI